MIIQGFKSFTIIIYKRSQTRAVWENDDFTTERSSDFADHWVPTLDFKISQNFEKNIYKHNFYEKHMNTKWVLPYLSSMDPSTRFLQMT